MSATKAALLSRIEDCSGILKNLIKENIGHPNSEIRYIISELVEAMARLEGRPEHDV